MRLVSSLCVGFVFYQNRIVCFVKGREHLRQLLLNNQEDDEDDDDDVEEISQAYETEEEEENDYQQQPQQTGYNKTRTKFIL